MYANKQEYVNSKIQKGEGDDHDIWVGPRNKIRIGLGTYKNESFNVTRFVVEQHYNKTLKNTHVVFHACGESLCLKISHLKIVHKRNLAPEVFNLKGNPMKRVWGTENMTPEELKQHKKEISDRATKKYRAKLKEQGLSGKKTVTDKAAKGSWIEALDYTGRKVK